LGGGIGQRSQGVKEHAFNRDDRYFSRAAKAFRSIALRRPL
jgi:hypothetical protein